MAVSRILLAVAFALFASQAFAAQETITLKDGRTFTGDYDESAGVIVVQVGKGPGHAEVKIRPEEIDTRKQIGPDVQEETPERRKIREQREAEEDLLEKRQAETAAKIADVNRQKAEADRRARDDQIARERLSWWRQQGYEFTPSDMSIESIDGLGHRYERAGVLKGRGYSFDPEKMTIEQMDAEVERRVQVIRDREQAAIDAEEERQDRIRLHRAEEERSAAIAAQRQREEREETARIRADRDYREAMRSADAEAAERREAQRRKDNLLLCIGIPIALATFLLPSVIAFLRRHRNVLAIIVLNIGLLTVPALQFTIASAYLGQVVTVSMNGIGAMAWLGALIWSIIKTDRDERPHGEQAERRRRRGPAAAPQPDAKPTGFEPPEALEPPNQS